MRPIKFRGKLSHSEQLIVGNLIIAQNGRPYIIPPEIFEPDGHHLIIDSDNAFWVEPDSVGQFTGLTDRNGKEVYEKDFVEKDDKIYVVRWNQLHVWWGLFTAGMQSRKEIMCDIADEDGNAPKDWTDSTLTVIGNLFENPELINQSK